MEKYFLNKNKLNIKAFSQTGKNLNTKTIDFKYKTINSPKKITKYQKITFYPIKRIYSDLTLSNRQIKEEIMPFKSKRNFIDKNLNIIEHKKKLESNIKKNLSNDELRNNSFLNNFRKKMNESIQSDLYSEEEIQNKINNHQNYVINCILNQRLKISKRPKLYKNNFGRLNIIDNLKYYYGKEKKYLNNEKLVHLYFKDKNQNQNLLNNKNIIPKKENIYEIVELDNKKQIIATKIKIDENDKIDDKLDCHSLMKYPENTKNNSIYNISNYSNILSNFSSSLKSRFKTKNLKSNFNNNQINYKDLKMLSQKGFEKMKERRYKGFTRIIGETIENVKSNRKKYDSLIEINLKIYNKNKNEILNNEI